MNVLLVEDDDLLAGQVIVSLAGVGYCVQHTNRAHQARLWLQQPDKRPDIMILDLGLPDMDGLELLRLIKRDRVTARVPVVVVTSRGTIENKVTGLDSGADDYLTKPFDIAELLARLRALARRVKPVSDSLITIAGVTLDLDSHLLSANGQSYILPRREFALLRIFMENPGRVFSREQLTDRIYSWNEQVSSNSLDVHIHSLRKKVGSDFIRSIRGVGWLVVNSREVKRALSFSLM